MVPGLFTAQHAGGGKAEQIFLRGFDIDHGTDIQLTVDGMPVNMVSHAHGQGYADLHFLIPETIEKVTYGFGPYSPGKGNLATAGCVEFKTKPFLANNSVKIEAGQFQMQRVSGLFKLFTKESGSDKQQFYLASEYSRYAGYFESPQDFHRFNLFGKYNAWFGNQGQLSISFSGFDSKWNASGQVPTRAVTSGMISRFGAIDNMEGGNTGRYNFNIQFQKHWKNNWKTNSQLYATRYHFKLYSNFTFFLEDSINGDQIRQRESRDLFGAQHVASRNINIAGFRSGVELGAGIRLDRVNDLQLSRTIKRVHDSFIQNGNVGETNTFVYWKQDLHASPTLRLEFGTRYDHFSFRYKDELKNNRKQRTRAVVTPKFNLTYTPSHQLSLFLYNGIGFHSNDTRVVLDQGADKILPGVYGTDLGFVLKPTKNLVSRITAWHLFSEQEFLYVGDAGIIEPGGRTRRYGVEISFRYQPLSWLVADMDLNLARARTVGAEKDKSFVPLSPSFTSTGGIIIKADRFNSSIRYRAIEERPANENNSVKAKGYFLLDLLLNYQLGPIQLFGSVENIMNRDWNEAQFETESRLRNETVAKSELHFTPGSPRYLKAGISLQF